MKHLFYLAALLIMPFNSVFAQNVTEDKAIVSHENLELKKNEITLNENALNFLTSPNGKYYATIAKVGEDRKKGDINEINVYSVDNNTKLWSKEYFPKKVGFKLTDLIALEIGGNSVAGLNLDNGEETWKQKPCLYVGCKGNVVLGFRTYAGAMKAFSLVTGEDMWNASIVVDNGLSLEQTIDDNNSFLVTTNLSRINWITGDRKKLSSKTFVNDKGALAARLAIGIVGGIAVGVASGGALVPVFYTAYEDKAYYMESRDLFIPANGDMICGLTSQVVKHDGKNYYADRDGVKCFDDDMNAIWKTNVPNNRASKSYITVRNNKLFVFNYGFGMRGGYKKQHTGRPFIAAFDINDGSQLKYEEMEGRKMMMTSIEERKDDICVLYENAISSVSLNDMAVKTVFCDTTIVGSFKRFLSNDDFYVKTDDETFSPVGSLSSEMVVLTDKNKVVEVSLNNQKNPSTVCQLEDVYVTIAKSGNRKFITGSNNNEIWCISDGKAHLIFDDVKLYKVKNNTLKVMTAAGKLYFVELAE